MADEELDVRGFTCPGPLVETRKKLKKMTAGQTLLIRGDHAPSKKEVPDTLTELGHEVISVTEEAGTWEVVVKKRE
jgi:TusA-related sulfurtransferase